MYVIPRVAAIRIHPPGLALAVLTERPLLVLALRVGVDVMRLGPPGLGLAMVGLRLGGLFAGGSLLLAGPSGTLVGLGGDAIGPRSVDVRLLANLPRLVPPLLVPSLLAAPAHQGHQHEHDQNHDHDRDDQSGTHMPSCLPRGVPAPYPAGRRRTHYCPDSATPGSSSLSSRLSTLPVALRGSSSRKMISRGTL